MARPDEHREHANAVKDARRAATLDAKVQRESEARTHKVSDWAGEFTPNLSGLLGRLLRK